MTDVDGTVDRSALGSAAGDGACTRTSLEQVLAEIAPRAHWQAGALQVQPVVDSLQLLRGPLGPDWDGMVHRRVQWGPGRLPDGLRLVRRRRAGWELVEAACEVDGAVVTHWLARRDAPAAAASPRRVPAGRGPVAPSSTAEATDTAPARCRQGRCAAGWVERAPDVGEADATDLVLSVASVRAWARSSGDDNLIHLRPGYAAAAGLEAGAGEVVAHGVLLLALGACVVGLPPSGTALFPRPLGVGTRGARVRVVPGEVVGDQGAVLRWRG